MTFTELLNAKLAEADDGWGPTIPANLRLILLALAAALDAKLAAAPAAPTGTP